MTLIAGRIAADMSAYYVSIDASKYASKYAAFGVIALSRRARTRTLNTETATCVCMCARRVVAWVPGVVETSHPSRDILDGKLYIVHLRDS